MLEGWPLRDERSRLSTLVIELPYNRPFDWPAVLGFFRLRAIPGLERIGDRDYVRTIGLPGSHGFLKIEPGAADDTLIATISAADIDVSEITGRLRQTLDLDADTTTIGKHLQSDSKMASLVACRPALRIPSHWDPYEDALRAILGQQVSMAAARRLIDRFLMRAGSIVGDVENDAPHRLFPTPQQVLTADFSDMGMPGSRVRTLIALTEAYLDNPRLFDRGATVEETVSRLQSIKGIGPWTAHYVAIRSCREPDAFPASDAGLLRGTADENGGRFTAEALMLRAEKWRPFRAYAAHHIWADDEAKVIALR